MPRGRRRYAPGRKKLTKLGNFSIIASLASINKGTHVGQVSLFGVFALFSLAGDSPPASKRTKIPRKSKAVRCEAVLPEQKCSQTRKSPQRILCVFSRALTQYERISARQNRVCPCQSTQRICKTYPGGVNIPPGCFLYRKNTKFYGNFTLI